MLIGLLTILFVFLCLILALAILIQQGKGDMGLSGLGSGGQMLFGGSGGQDFISKLTWVLGAFFVFGALGLAILKNKQVETSKIRFSAPAPITSTQPTQMPIKPLSENVHGEETQQPLEMPSETEQLPQQS